MATDTAPSVTRVPPRRLWFGFAASAASWLFLGCLDIVITWRACMHQENFGIPASPSSPRIAFAVIALFLLAITIAAGFISYRNWRSLSMRPRALEAEAVDRREFMALLGVIVSITLGAGIIWLGLPPLFLDICWRAR
jgi:hypothetical protein